MILNVLKPELIPIQCLFAFFRHSLWGSYFLPNVYYQVAFLVTYKEIRLFDHLRHFSHGHKPFSS